MKLELNEQGLTHSSLIANFESIAQNCTTLDATEHALGLLGLSRDWWKVTRGGNHVAVNYMGGAKPIRCAMFTEGDQPKPRKPRQWDHAILTLVAAQQDNIAVGDIVRCYDFPGSRDDTYVEGVVKVREAGRGENRVLVHVLRDVWQGVDEQVGNRFEVWSPLGVSSMTDAPCVFLIAKRKVSA